MAVHGLPADRSPASEAVATSRRLVALDVVTPHPFVPPEDVDPDRTAVLDVAVVSIVGWQPDPDTGFSTLVNPTSVPPLIQRQPWIAARPWIPDQPSFRTGPTDAELRRAPALPHVLPDLSARLSACYVVGYNVRTSWRVLHDLAPS